MGTRRTALWTVVYEELRRRIQTLDLEPGARLSEAALAAEFKLSPTPVRDALSRLSQEGLVEVSRSRGYTVATLTVPDIQDICDARFAIETGVVTLAAERMTPKHHERLTELSRLTGDTTLSPVELIARNQEFHVALAEVTGSPRLIGSVRRIMDDSTRVFHLGLLAFAEHGMQSEHDRMIAAVSNRELTEAVNCCRREAYGTSERVLASRLRSPWAATSMQPDHGISQSV